MPPSSPITDTLKVRHRLAALLDPKSVVVVAAADSPQHFQFKAANYVATVHSPYTQWPEWDVTQPRLDLAVVCIENADLEQVLNQLSLYKPKALLLLTHSSNQAFSPEQLQRLSQWGLTQRSLIVGPRSFGLMRPVAQLNASIQSTLPVKGKIAVLSQSRTVLTGLLDWSVDAQVGLSTVLDMGEETGVDLAAVLDYLAVDPHTDSVVLYLHSHPASRRFASAIYAASAAKPIIVLKAGVLAEDPAVRAREEVFSALLRRVGAIRVHYLIQVYAALKVLGFKRRIKGNRLAIVANGDGMAQLALDIIRHGATIQLATLSTKSTHALAQLATPSDTYQNPIIRYAPWSADYTEQLLQTLSADEQVDGVLVLLAPDPYTDQDELTQALVTMSTKLYKPLISCMVGEYTMRAQRHRLEQAGVPVFRTPDTATDAVNTLASYYQSQRLAQQILHTESVGPAEEIGLARQLIEHLQTQGVEYLSEADSAQLLRCFQVPIRAQARPHSLTSLPPVSIQIYTDEQYGPFIIFGAARGRLDVINQRTSIALPPLNRYLAQNLIERAAIWRDRIAKQAGSAISKQLEQSLEHLASLVSEIPAIRRLQIDPLWLSPSGLYSSKIVVQLHAHSSMPQPERSGYPHMAIHPYPRHLVQKRQFNDGTPWVLRPIRPEDAQALQDFVRGLSAESRYMRFVSMMRELSPSMLYRYARIDYDRELALVATLPPNTASEHTEQVIAFAHYLRNKDGIGAEYALVVDDQWQRHGLGKCLMQALIAAAKQQRLSYIDGYVLASNYAMLGLLASLGFQNDVDRYDPSLRRVWLKI